MAQALILDSEALNALANAGHRGSLGIRARAIARVAHERGALLRVPAPVLAEVCRGSRLDAAVNQVLNREAVRVADLTREIAQRAGALLARTRMSSENAIDAFVVATALEYELSVLATADYEDLARLSARIDRSRSWNSDTTLRSGRGYPPKFVGGSPFGEKARTGTEGRVRLPVWGWVTSRTRLHTLPN